MLQHLRHRALLIASGIVGLVAACSIGTVRVSTLDAPIAGRSTTITTPVKAHLADGSTVRFPGGVTLANGVVTGAGTRVGLTLQPIGQVERVLLDSVVGMEAYERVVDPAASVFLSVAGVGLSALAVAGAAVAIFGSCPTFYSDSSGTAVLEAEGFSYSIAALYESRDVDRLRTAVTADGTVRIEVRNEALETHFINHLELLEVPHARDETVVPDAAGKPVVVGRLTSPLMAVDQKGVDILATVATADGVVTRQPSDGITRTANDLDHTIDLIVPVPAGADSIAVVFRLRNSLLNTILLYDIMLGSRGLKSLEWQSNDLREIGPALEVAQWYSSNMGLRLLAVDGTDSRELARLRDTGPIAFKDVALVIAAPRTATMHLRIQHVMDNWRIDQVSVATMRRPTVSVVPLAAAIDAAGGADTTVLAALAAPDGRYLETVPGQFFTAVWRPAAMPADTTRTFLLASQGYYIEWMRRDWLAAPRDTMPFRPHRESIATALSVWRTAQDSLERHFHDSRLPVR